MTAAYFNPNPVMTRGPLSGAGQSLISFFRNCSFGGVTFLPTNNIIVPVEVPCSGSTATGAALRPASTFCETADQFAWMEYAESLALCAPYSALSVQRYLAAALGWVGGGGSFALELALGGLSILLRLLLCAWLAREYWALNLWQLAVWLTGCMAAVGAGVGPPHGLQVDQVFFAPQS
ncbi:gametolysin peptidase M11 [Haematococcus lacustris]|uniref:Gametolysin peptidase M11 n=1 Tax=Haematococcus lacustris TaxID=44745 RepID=A0A6A0AD35_HAELA|nr:gametolysin peptidase M11 [Haematococcus lacustris]